MLIGFWSSTEESVRVVWAQINDEYDENNMLTSSVCYVEQGVEIGIVLSFIHFYLNIKQKQSAGETKTN